MTEQIIGKTEKDKFINQIRESDNYVLVSIKSNKDTGKDSVFIFTDHPDNLWTIGILAECIQKLAESDVIAIPQNQ